jgi:hypothetical protein
MGGKAPRPRAKHHIPRRRAQGPGRADLDRYQIVEAGSVKWQVHGKV